MRRLCVGDVAEIGDATVYDEFCDKPWARGQREEEGEGRTWWNDISRLSRKSEAGPTVTEPRNDFDSWLVCISHSWHSFFTIYFAHAHIAPLSSSTGCLFQRRQCREDLKIIKTAT